MIKVLFDPPNGLNDEQRIWWDKWLARAELKQAEAKAGAELDSAVWRDLKDWLLKNVFHRKCAYCEAVITANYPGDGEHYRPKGNVTVKAQGRKQPITHPATGAKHTGYYWLAYNWRNLLPACFACNNAKSDQFPVAQSHVHDAAPDPSVLDQHEVPLLIYPYFDEPEEHLVFGEFGIVAAKDGDLRGLATIEVFDLMREDLVDDRYRRQEEVKPMLKEAIGKTMDEDKPVGAFLADWIGPKAPFSRAVAAYINLRLAKIDREV